VTPRETVARTIPTAHTIRHPGVADDALAADHRRHTTQENPMPKFIIEREIPGLGTMSNEELAAAATTSNTVLAAMAPHVQWQHSYVTDDKMYCVYIADDADVVREHARRGGFPADAVSHVGTIIDPTTAQVG
jgi:hypothetical protein